MKVKGELKSFKSKALVSQDKSIELKIYVIANDENKVDVQELHNLLLKPLEIEIKEDGR
jgi:hypothetical protein